MAPQEPLSNPPSSFCFRVDFLSGVCSSHTFWNTFFLSSFFSASCFEEHPVVCCGTQEIRAQAGEIFWKSPPRRRRCPPPPQLSAAWAAIMDSYQLAQHASSREGPWQPAEVPKFVLLHLSFGHLPLASLKDFVGILSQGWGWDRVQTGSAPPLFGDGDKKLGRKMTKSESLPTPILGTISNIWGGAYAQSALCGTHYNLLWQ